MNDRDRIHGNDTGDARVITRTSPWTVTIAIWQNALAEEWYSALAQQVIAGRRSPTAPSARTPPTISSTTWFLYKRTLRLWLRYLDDEACTDDPSTATVIAYRTWLQTTRPQLSVATLNNRIDTIQAFYRWTASVARFPDIAASLSSITDARTAPLAVLSKRDVQRMIDRMGDETLRDVRNRALVWLLFGGALETISLHRATVADIDTSMGTLRHQPRGHRRADVVTALPREAIAAVTHYLTMRAPLGSEPLFTSTRHAEPQRLSTLSMRLTVRRCLDAFQARRCSAGTTTTVESSTVSFVPSALRVSGLCHRLGGRTRMSAKDLVRVPREAKAVGYRSTRAARNLVKRCLPAPTTVG